MHESFGGGDFTCHLLGSILRSKPVSSIDRARLRVAYFDTLRRLVIDNPGPYGALGYFGRAPTGPGPQKLRTTQMWRANINLFPVECNRASAKFNRVWQLVVSQLVNGEAGTTLVCSDCPPVSFLCFSSRCTDLRASPPPPRASTRFLPTPFVRRLSLSYGCVIHRWARKGLHPRVDLPSLRTVTIYLLLVDHAAIALKRKRASPRRYMKHLFASVARNLSRPLYL